MPRPSLLPELLTQFAPLNAVLSVVERVALSESPVLISGERGTGKTLLARAIHSASRRPGPLAEIDASALPAELLDAELFGLDDESPALRRPGALESSGQGTVLIDEVAAMGHTAQTKLLSVMSRGMLTGRDAARVEITARVIATTAYPIGALARDGRFSEPLHERLRNAHIELPPLRERRADIPLLAQHFVAQFGGLRAPRLSPESLAVLEEYSWPGNVRELRTVIERAVAGAHRGEIRTRDLSALVTPGAAIGSPVRLADLERRHIEAVLLQTHWHRGRAATLLGISPKTLYRKIREYGFTAPNEPAG